MLKIKVCLRFNFKSFSRFAKIHKIPINVEDDIKLWLSSLCITCIMGANMESPNTMSNTSIKKKLFVTSH